MGDERIFDAPSLAISKAGFLTKARINRRAEHSIVKSGFWLASRPGFKVELRLVDALMRERDCWGGVEKPHSWWWELCGNLFHSHPN